MRKVCPMAGSPAAARFGSATCGASWTGSLLGGLLTLVLLQVRALPLPGLLSGQDWAERLHRKDTGVPYGIALAAAALLVYPDTIWMKAIAG